MIILTVYRSVLLNVTAVNSLATGGYHLGKVVQDSVRPNVLLQKPDGGQDYSHQGPVGLHDAHVKITARADTAQAAALLGDEIRKALEDWTGTLFGCVVQMTEHMKSSDDYDEGAKVFMQIEEFTSFYTRTS